MNCHLTSMEFQLMQRYIEGHCGIKIGPEKAYLIETRLANLLKEFGYSSFGQLYSVLNDRKDTRITERVIDAITTNETMWFRDKTPWTILWEVLLPEYVRQIREGQRRMVRIWSAGCSTGQEPYSIAMAIHRYLEQNRITDIPISRFEILATDISRAVLDAAEEGKYDNLSMARGLEEYYKNKYFSREGDMWVISKEVRNMVSYKKFNLQNSFLGLGKFDIIFCRYVIIYFSQELKKAVFEKITRSLNTPGGVLFMGNSEVFSDYKDFYTREESQGGIYYRIKEDAKWI